MNKSKQSIVYLKCRRSECFLRIKTVKINTQKKKPKKGEYEIEECKIGNLKIWKLKIREKRKKVNNKLKA